jgi:hypothetical protein
MPHHISSALWKNGIIYSVSSSKNSLVIISPHFPALEPLIILKTSLSSMESSIGILYLCKELHQLYIEITLELTTCSWDFDRKNMFWTSLKKHL